MVGLGRILANIRAGATDVVRVIQRPGEAVKGAAKEAAKEAVAQGGVAKAVRQAYRTATAAVPRKGEKGAQFQRVPVESYNLVKGVGDFVGKVGRAAAKQAGKGAEPGKVHRPATAKQLAARAAFAARYGKRKR